MAVAAFSDNPVGIDCETVGRKVSFDLVKRFLSSEEAEIYKNDTLLLWVASESIQKLSGDGIFRWNKRLFVPFFEGNTAVSGKITLEKFLINDNLVVFATEHYEKAKIIPI